MAINYEPTVEPQTVASIFTKHIAKVIPLAFDESMSYYECICAFRDYLNTVIIPNVNNVNDGLAEIQQIFLDLQADVNTEIENFENGITSDFNNLHDYVENYFANLDVQDEINNKLDAMVQDGTLQEIVADYLNSKAVFGFDNVASLKASTNLINGSYAETLGYYSKNDGGSSLYKIRELETNETANNMSTILLNNGLIAELITKKDSISIAQLGAKNDDDYDNTSIFQFAINYCISNKIKLIINGGVYKITDTLDVPESIYIEGIGSMAGELVRSEIKFYNSNEIPLFNLRHSSTACTFKSLFINGISNQSIGIRIAGNPSTAGYNQNWKNYFENCSFIRFKTALLITTDQNPLDGTTHDFASENMFNHCKFKHNTIDIINENMQSLNNLFIQTDFEENKDENYNTSYSFGNFAGGGFKFDTCSFVTSKKIYYQEYKTGGSSLFEEGTITYENCRFEMSPNFSGTMIYQNENKGTTYQHVVIFMNNCIIRNQTSQRINIIDFVGRMYLYINNLNVHDSTYNIVYNNVAGVSGTITNALAGVNINNVVGKIDFVQGNRGTDGPRYKPLLNYTNNAFFNTDALIDSDNFYNFTVLLNKSYSGSGFSNNIINNLVLNEPTSGYNFGDKKIILPSELNLLKLFFFKQGSRYDFSSTINLYMVKNKSLWAGSTFNVATDGVLISTINIPVGSVGYAEAPIKISGTNYGNDIRTGKLSDFSECRYYIESTTSAEDSGIVGISYI